MAKPPARGRPHEWLRGHERDLPRAAERRRLAAASERSAAPNNGLSVVQRMAGYRSVRDRQLPARHVAIDSVGTFLHSAPSSSGAAAPDSRLERANIIGTASSEPCYEGPWQDAPRSFSAQASAAEDPRSRMLVDLLMADFDHRLGELTSHGSDDASTWAHMPPRPRTCNHGDGP
jgi:hypothetical protein